MLTVSDNTATDIILRVIGGPTAVDRQISETGINGMSVDRPIFLVLANCWGINCLTEDDPVSEDEIAKLRSQISKEKRIKARREYINDTRDTTTPEAMAKLLKKIWLREAMSDESANVLLNIMEKAKGEKRIKGLLPPGTKVYHKTGTITGGLSDVGIVELPNNAGHVVVVEFVKGGRRTIAAEAAMARIAKEAYDYFNQNSKID
jgi:beta-lactamase class A